MLPRFRKTIFTGFSPNTTPRDVLTALKFLTLPNKWPLLRNGGFIGQAEDKIKNYFKIKYSAVFDSGRSALYFALKALDVGEGDEVIAQAYTCVVVVNAIKWAGAIPVLADIEDDFNISFQDVKKKITTKTKVIIIQNTFGNPADVKKIKEIADQHGIKIIEDCAHALGSLLNHKLVGTFGDIAMLSFGSDKVISCIRGGALITNDAIFAKRIDALKKNLPDANLFVTIQHLLHLPIFLAGKFLYSSGVGKLALFLAKKLCLINKIIYKKEKQGKQVAFYPSRLPNSLAKILCDQLDELDYVNSHRKTIAKIYREKISNTKIIHPPENPDSIYLRYTILVDNPKKLTEFAKSKGVILGNWYDAAVAPSDVNQARAGYMTGSCPNAERLASATVNLPTNRHVSEKDAKRIIKIINEYD